jgi:hypothetical protein
MTARSPGGSVPVSSGSKLHRPARRLVLGAVLALVAVLSWWWTHPPVPEAELRADLRPLVALERMPAPELGRGFERWRMLAERGDTVTGLWRAAAKDPAAAPGHEPDWAVVILGGIGTDDRAALLVPDSLPVGVLAVSWPWKGPRRMSRLTFLASVPALRAALLSTPGALARGVEAVRRAAPGARVALLGASLGAPPTVAALPLARPDALVLVDGAADLERLLRSETARTLGGGAGAALLARPAAALGARLVSSLEPARHRAAAALPVLLVDAVRDERYPRECIARLHATFPHATLATHPGGHIRPEDRPQIAAIVETARRWLGGLPVTP